MRDWWSNRFVLPVLTTPTTAAAREKIALIEGSSAACGSGGAAAQPGRQRSRSQRRGRGGRGGDRQQDKNKGNDQPQKELCNLYNACKWPCVDTLWCKFDRLHRCKYCKAKHPGDECRANKKGGGKGNKGGKNTR